MGDEGGRVVDEFKIYFRRSIVRVWWFGGRERWVLDDFLVFGLKKWVNNCAFNEMADREVWKGIVVDGD